MRIALLSNVTPDLLAARLSSRHAVWKPSGFAAWMQAALEPPADLLAFDPELIALVLDPRHAAPASADVRAARTALEGRFPSAAVVVPDLEDLFSPLSCADPAAAFDDRLWQLASMPWSLAGLESVAAEIERLAGLLRGGAKKALAVDFDGTLWDGVVGEDGPEGIAPRVEFQRALKALADRGVLLVGLSRNNAAEVEPAWRHPRMALACADFVATRVDWNDKPANLAAVASELNLGLDAFVFLDDNPAERAHMRAACPAVEVPDPPSAAADWTLFLRHLVRLHFPELRTTAEDLRKTEMYRAESARKGAAASAVSLSAYLSSLRIETDVHPARPEEFSRIAQLSQKANQFNVLTVRRTAAEIAAFAADPHRLVFAAESRDRFGDLGLISFVNVRLPSSASASAEIDDWVMSCRAMNRGIEQTVFAALKAELAVRGVGTLAATYRPTAKNHPVADLFPGLGFTAAGSGRYTLAL